MPVHLMNNETSKKEKKFPVHDVLFCCCYPTNSYDFCLPQDGRIFHLFKECVCVGEITSFLMCGRWEAINAFRSPNVLTIGLICVQITSIFLLILCVTTAYCLTDYFNSWNIQCVHQKGHIGRITTLFAFTVQSYIMIGPSICILTWEGENSLFKQQSQ